MKTVLITLSLCSLSVSGFVPVAFSTRGVSAATRLFSEPEKNIKDEPEGLDLNLEEMFEMYDIYIG